MPRRCSGLLHGPSQLQLARVMRLRSKLECCVNSLEIASGAAYRFDRRWHAIFAIGWTSRKKYHLKSCLKQRDRATRFFWMPNPPQARQKNRRPGLSKGLLPGVCEIKDLLPARRCEPERYYGCRRRCRLPTRALLKSGRPTRTINSGVRMQGWVQCR